MKSLDMGSTRWERLAKSLDSQRAEIELEKQQFEAVRQPLRNTLARLQRLNLFGTYDAIDLDISHVLTNRVVHSFALRRHEIGEMEGYRQAVSDLLKESLTSELNIEVIRRWHRLHMGSEIEHRGEWKQEDNILPENMADGTWHTSKMTTDKELVPQVMDELLAAFSWNWQAYPKWRFYIACTLVLDFLKVHPFFDGNGRTGRLLLLFLLRKLGYTVWEYRSLEDEISHHREAYIQTLQASQKNHWSDWSYDPNAWCRFCIDITQDAYRRLRSSVDMLAQLADHTERVHACLQRLPSPFGRLQVSEEAVGVNLCVIDLVLGSLVDRGLLSVSRWQGQASWSWRGAKDSLGVG